MKNVKTGFDDVIWRKNDTPDYFKFMLCCSGTLKIMPRMSVCNDYHIPVTEKQLRYLFSKFDMIFDYANINGVLDTHVRCLPYARKIQAMMTSLLMLPYNKYKFKKVSMGFDIYVQELRKFKEISQC